MQYQTSVVGGHIHPTLTHNFFQGSSCTVQSCIIVLQNNVFYVDNRWALFNLKFIYLMQLFTIKVCIDSLSRFQHFKICPRKLHQTHKGAFPFWDVNLAKLYFVAFHSEKATALSYYDYHRPPIFHLQWPNGQKMLVLCCWSNKLHVVNRLALFSSDSLSGAKTPALFTIPICCKFCWMVDQNWLSVFYSS